MRRLSWTVPTLGFLAMLAGLQLLLSGPAAAQRQAIYSTRAIKALERGIARSLFVRVTTATTVGTSEEVLYSYPMPGGTIADAGAGIQVVCAGTATSGADAKRLSIFFGATEVAAKTIDSATAGQAEATILRITSTTQTSRGRGGKGPNIGVEAPVIYVTSPAETLTSAVNVQCRATTPSGAGQIVGTLFLVTYVPPVVQ